MKHLYALLVALLGLIGPALAYNYHPFHPFLRYQLSEGGSPGDSTFYVHLNFGTPGGSFGPFTPDSVYWLNSRAIPVGQRQTGTCAVSHVVTRRGGLFGASITVLGQQNGLSPMHAEYVLRATNGRTFTLKPRAALNQNWTATTGITARVTARSVSNIFGQSDSTVTITLSDGQQIRLSKRYGWLEGPALGAYLNGQRPRHLVTTALEGAFGTLGATALGNLGVFDYQPGDVFLRYRRQESTQTGMLCSESWQRDSVVTRSSSRSGDTLTYTIATRQLTRNYGSPSAPFGMCQNTPGTIISGPSTGTLTVSRQDVLITNPAQQPYLNNYVATGTFRTADFNRRMQLHTQFAPICGTSSGPDSTQLVRVVDVGGARVYVAGLGQVAALSGDVGTNDQQRLIGYRKVNLPASPNPETWGSLRTFAAILKAVDFRPAASTSVFPNPFAEELTVRFEAQRPQPVTVRLYNALGQQVHAQQQNVASGSALIRLPTPSLAAGLYTLHLVHDGRTEVLRVAAAGR